MPAKKVVSKEIIIKSAMEMLECEGIRQINARSLAKWMKCSTQPIYLSFASMDELKSVLFEESKKIYNKYIEREMQVFPDLFMGYLYAYILFAKEHPKLFEYIYMINKYENTEENQKETEAIVEQIMLRGQYTKEVAYKFYLQSWIYAHGFATQFVTGYSKWDLETIKDFMKDEFEALKKVYRGL